MDAAVVHPNQLQMTHNQICNFFRSLSDEATPIRFQPTALGADAEYAEGSQRDPDDEAAELVRELGKSGFLTKELRHTGQITVKKFRSFVQEFCATESDRAALAVGCTLKNRSPCELIQSP